MKKILITVTILLTYFLGWAFSAGYIANKPHECGPDIKLNMSQSNYFEWKMQRLCLEDYENDVFIAPIVAVMWPLYMTLEVTYGIMDND